MQSSRSTRSHKRLSGSIKGQKESKRVKSQKELRVKKSQKESKELRWIGIIRVKKGSEKSLQGQQGHNG